MQEPQNDMYLCSSDSSPLAAIVITLGVKEEIRWYFHSIAANKDVRLGNATVSFWSAWTNDVFCHLIVDDDDYDEPLLISTGKIHLLEQLCAFIT